MSCTPLRFLPSFLRKGKNKPKSISSEVILCQGTPDVFAAPVYSHWGGKKPHASIWWRGPALCSPQGWPAKIAELFIQCVTEVQLEWEVIVLLVWQEAASLTSEANVTGLKRVGFSAAPVYRCGHCEGCLVLVCSATKKLTAFLRGTNLPEWKGNPWNL